MNTGALKVFGKKSLSILKVVLIVGLFVWVGLKFDASAARDILRSAHMGWALTAVLCTAVGHLFYAYRVQMLARGFWPDLKLTPWNFYHFNLLAMFYTLFIPTFIAGEAVRVLKMGGKLNNDYPRCTLTVTLDRILGVSFWFLLFFLFPSPVHYNKWLLLFLLPLPGLYFLQHKIVIWKHKVFDISRHRPADLVRAAGASLIGQFLYLLTNFAVFYCFGLHLTFIQVAGIAILGILAGIVPVSWLGIGMREGVYLAFLPSYGLSTTQIFFVMTFLVAINYLFSLIGGFIELANLGWDFSRLKKITPQEANPE